MWQQEAAGGERYDAIMTSGDVTIQCPAIGATLTHVRCSCSFAVPVKCGDVTGMSLDDMIATALLAAEATCPDHTSAVPVGADA